MQKTLQHTKMWLHCNAMNLRAGQLGERHFLRIMDPDGYLQDIRGLLQVKA